MNINVYQIYYLPEQKCSLDPAFIPFDNISNPEPDWCEYGVFKRAYESGLLAAGGLAGMVSWKFGAKTLIQGCEFLGWIASNPGYDFYFINPFPGEVIKFRNVWHQGEACHPGIMDVSERVLAAAGLDFEIREHFSMLDDSGFCNYFVANDAFWKEYIEVGRKVEDAIRTKVSEEDRAFIYRRADRVIRANFIPFIYERLFPLILRSGKYKHLAFPVDESSFYKKYGDFEGAALLECYQLKKSAYGSDMKQDYFRYSHYADLLKEYHALASRIREFRNTLGVAK